MCHNRSVRSITQSCSVCISIYTYSHEHNNITVSSEIWHTTTCFGPVCRPSSGCPNNLLSDYAVRVVILEGGGEISSYTINRGISKSWNKHVMGLHQLWTAYDIRRNWSLTLREERKLRVFENMVLRIFGPRRDEVTRDWRRLHNEELNNLYSSPNILRVIKSRRMRWVGHVARVGEERESIGS